MTMTTSEPGAPAAARRRAGRGTRARRASAPTLSLARIAHPYAPLALFDEDEIEAIHLTAMRILEELGIELLSADARARLAAAGAEVDEGTQTVRLDRGLVAELVARAPAAFDLTPANPEHRVHLGGRDVVTSLVAGPPAVHDRIRGRRQANLEDYCDFIRLTHLSDAVHMIGNQVAAPIELDAETRHLDCYLANLTLSDRSYHCTAIGRARAVDGIEMMALARGISVEAMAADPGVTTIISVNSPRRFDDAMADGLVAMAEHGQAAAITPFTLMGAMSPVTLPAALAQQTAEALFGVCLAQAVRPGAPVMYGAFTSNVDMKSGAPAFGTPEHVQALVASGQLARRYGLPYRASPVATSNAADAEAAWEQMMALWGCAMGGAHLWYHAAGWLEGGLCASFEKFVMDVDMLEQMFAFLRKPAVDEASLGFDAIAQVPPGGHFFGTEHTLARYETAFHKGKLSDWRNHESWQADGAKTAEIRATERWQTMLAEYAPPEMDPARREALEAFVARRKEEIARDGL
ncbi:MAG: trimethylamine methyltransferase family protein [Paracoccaceae bacterium]